MASKPSKPVHLGAIYDEIIPATLNVGLQRYHWRDNFKSELPILSPYTAAVLAGAPIGFAHPRFIHNPFPINSKLKS